MFLCKALPNNKWIWTSEQLLSSNISAESTVLPVREGPVVTLLCTVTRRIAVESFVSYAVITFSQSICKIHQTHTTTHTHAHRNLMVCLILALSYAFVFVSRSHSVPLSLSLEMLHLPLLEIWDEISFCLSFIDQSNRAVSNRAL
jgi:hypothetical protein